MTKEDEMMEKIDDVKSRLKTESIHDHQPEDDTILAHLSLAHEALRIRKLRKDQCPQPK